MTDAPAAAPATHGRWRATLLPPQAGLARGFSGLGSGLIFAPIAGIVLPKVRVVTDLVNTIGACLVHLKRATLYGRAVSMTIANSAPPGLPIGA